VLVYAGQLTMKLLIKESSFCVQHDTALNRFKSDTSFALMTATDAASDARLSGLVNTFGYQHAGKFSFLNPLRYFKMEPIYPYWVDGSGDFASSDSEKVKLGGIFIRKGKSLRTVLQHLNGDPTLDITLELTEPYAKNMARKFQRRTRHRGDLM